MTPQPHAAQSAPVAPRPSPIIADPAAKDRPAVIRDGRVMRIAQIAPLSEAVPPLLYGGTERIVAYLCDELVALLADHRILMNHASGVLFPSSRSLGSRSTPAHSLAVCRTPGMRRA